MTTEAYLSELKRRLHGLTEDERADVLDFYEEYAADADLTTGEAITKKLGTPKQLARKVLADYSIKQNDTAAQKGERRSPRTNANMMWVIILAIASTPVTIPVAIAILAVLLSVLIVTLALVGSGIVVAIALIGAAVAVTALALYTGAFMIGAHFYVGLAYLGIGLTSLGAALVLIPLCFYVIRLFIQMAANFIRYLYGRLRARRQLREEK